jgi:acyl-homoserine lactone acylase PvdQ
MRNGWTRAWSGLGLLGLLLATPAAAELPGTGADAGRTVVYRDGWGVPHIYAPTLEAGLYAQGWAQAQDRPRELLANFKRALGEAAEFEGPAAVPFDWVSRVWDHHGTARRHADRLQPHLRRHLRAFAAGMRAWYADHPEDVPEWWGDREIDEYLLIAFGRLFLYAWSIEQTFADLRRAGIDPGLGEYHHGSNQWAVAPSRSAEGVAMLLIDPHLSWWGASRFWEFRIHAGELVGSGFTLPGFPYIGLGHTRHLAWAMTTGGPDTADVYALDLDPDDPTRYRYAGGWRELTKREITLRVKGEAERAFSVWSSHHGPVLAVRDGTAYAARSAYADVVGISEAWLALNLARDYRGAQQALATLRLFPQNVMVADTSGNIWYQRAGRVPNRPVGPDWSRPVDGTTPATEWLGLHPAEDLPQVLNPPSGYMQNCNVPPEAMFPGSPLTPDRYPDYVYADAIYGPRSGWTNQRGARSVELLDADDSVSVEDALAWAVDVRPYGIERWQTALRGADARFGEKLRASPEYRAGLAALLTWNGRITRDSRGALQYYYWRTRLLEANGAAAVDGIAERIDFLPGVLGRVRPARSLDPQQLRALAAAVAPDMQRLREDHGSSEAVWGDKFRVGRDAESWPVGGSSLRELGLRTLRSVGYAAERADRTRWGESGQTSTQVVVLHSPPRSWTYVPIGQSDRADSPHYRDQAQKLFSPRRLKPSRWRPEDLAGHFVSRTVLEGAP